MFATNLFKLCYVMLKGGVRDCDIGKGVLDLRISAFQWSRWYIPNIEIRRLLRTFCRKLKFLNNEIHDVAKTNKIFIL